MSRYFTQRRSDAPRAEYWWDDPFRPDLSVSDHVATDTGLLDQRGDPIMRAPNPMGFMKDDEW